MCVGGPAYASGNGSKNRKIDDFSDLQTIVLKLVKPVHNQSEEFSEDV